MSSANAARTECVVDARGEQVIVWQVATEPVAGQLSRMSGAWVLGPDEKNTLDSLIADHRVLATSAARQLIAERDIPIRGYIDPDTTVKNIELACDELQIAFDHHADRSQHDLVAPTWPALPASIDRQNPPTAASEPPTRVALGLARWLLHVALIWDRIEAQRLLRPYLPGGRKRLSAPIATERIDR